MKPQADQTFFHKIRPWTEWRKTAGGGLLLVLTIWTLYGQTRHHDFINFDDNEYVIENPIVLGGLTWSGIAQAFLQPHASNWNPLAWLSHMLDVQLYGMNPAGHHLTSVLFHALNAVLLFWLLRQMTGALGPSFFAAAFFAVHPLRVESVAWIAERKDVLSGFFFFLTLIAYVHYARSGRSPGRYVLVLILFACGLTAKPMLVTLPLVLLLLDYWPLNRLHPAADEKPAVFLGKKTALSKRVILEKIPFFVLSLFFSLATLAAQKGALSSLESLSLTVRLENATAAYAIYLRQMVYPAGLTIFYPYPVAGVPPTMIALSLILLLGVSWGIWRLRQKRPYLFVGWLWYLIMLGPVIGILQVGAQAHSDHHTYLPQIGLAIALVWLLADWADGQRLRQSMLVGSASFGLVLLGFLAWRQISYWRNSETLWTHTLAHTQNNALAHFKLSLALAQKERWEEALGEGEQALQIDPNLSDAHYNMGQIFLRKREWDKATGYFKKALEINPLYAKAHNSLAALYAGKGQWQECVEHFQQAVEIDPRNAEAHRNLCVILAQMGRPATALEHGLKALEMDPDDPMAHYNAGNALQILGQLEEAISHYEKALELNPSYAEAHHNLAIAFSQKGQLQEAQIHFQRALELNPSSAEIHYNWGQLLESAGYPQEAMLHYQQALQIDSGHAGARNRLNAASSEKQMHPGKKKEK